MTSHALPHVVPGEKAQATVTDAVASDTVLEKQAGSLLGQSSDLPSNAETCRLVLTDIGSAGIDALRPLKAMFPKASDQKLASLLLKAPSTLLESLPLDKAAEIKQLLSGIGLTIDIQSSSDSAPAVDGKAYELALHLKTGKQMAYMPLLLKQIVHLLGANPKQAIEMLLHEPCVVIGGLSMATAEVLAERFDSDFVDPIICEPRLSQFDAFVGTISATIRQSMTQRLISMGLKNHLVEDTSASATKRSGKHISSGLLACELSIDQGEKLFETLRQFGADCQLINRAYQRYDLKLHALTDKCDRSALNAMLVQELGIPEQVLPKLMTRLPIIIAKDLPMIAVAEHMMGLSEVGAQVSAELANGQRFALEILRIGDARASKAALENLSGVSHMQRDQILEGRQTRIEGPMTRVQAAWLAYEINQAGGQAKMQLLSPSGGRA